MDNKYVIIDNDTKVILNTIIWDGITPFPTPPNTFLKLESELLPEEKIYPKTEE